MREVVGWSFTLVGKVSGRLIKFYMLDSCRYVAKDLVV